MLNHNLVKLYVHCEINETIEMTFKFETKLDTWHINCKFKKIFWKKKNSAKKNFGKKFFLKKKKILKNFKIFFEKNLFSKKFSKIISKIFQKTFFFF